MKKYLGLAIISSLTLGLAPFVPHAHIWKQIMNIYHGRTMTGMDWLSPAVTRQTNWQPQPGPKQNQRFLAWLVQ